MYLWIQQQNSMSFLQVKKKRTKKSLNKKKKQCTKKMNNQKEKRGNLAPPIFTYLEDTKRQNKKKY